MFPINTIFDFQLAFAGRSLVIMGDSVSRDIALSLPMRYAGCDALDRLGMQLEATLGPNELAAEWCPARKIFNHQKRYNHFAFPLPVASPGGGHPSLAATVEFHWSRFLRDFWGTPVWERFVVNGDFVPGRDALVLNAVFWHLALEHERRFGMRNLTVAQLFPQWKRELDEMVRRLLASPHVEGLKQAVFWRSATWREWPGAGQSYKPSFDNFHINHANRYARSRLRKAGFKIIETEKYSFHGTLAPVFRGPAPSLVVTKDSVHFPPYINLVMFREVSSSVHLESHHLWPGPLAGALQQQQQERAKRSPADGLVDLALPGGLPAACDAQSSGGGAGSVESPREEAEAETEASEPDQEYSEGSEGAEDEGHEGFGIEGADAVAEADGISDAADDETSASSSTSLVLAGQDDAEFDSLANLSATDYYGTPIIEAASGGGGWAWPWQLQGWQSVRCAGPADAAHAAASASGGDGPSASGARHYSAAGQAHLHRPGLGPSGGAATSTSGRLLLLDEALLYAYMAIGAVMGAVATGLAMRLKGRGAVGAAGAAAACCSAVGRGIDSVANGAVNLTISPNALLPLRQLFNAPVTATAPSAHTASSSLTSAFSSETPAASYRGRLVRPRQGQVPTSAAASAATASTGSHAQSSSDPAQHQVVGLLLSSKDAEAAHAMNGASTAVADSLAVPPYMEAAIPSAHSNDTEVHVGPSSVAPAAYWRSGRHEHEHGHHQLAHSTAPDN